MIYTIKHEIQQRELKEQEEKQRQKEKEREQLELKKREQDLAEQKMAIEKQRQLFVNYLKKLHLLIL
ncbi:hypothetical protein CUN26_00250 [Enterococcus faecium]|uniref:hypothetical protein n=1 Tax=Enterococcus faecium TaxID=1352 RepID=UPI000CF06C11|nr:hypothetical protein [Enterococcus faecium]PQB75925.1 hypothetical protein CUN26_00250 [Enterococcus faecium]